MTIAIFDPFSGIAGDMTLGALIDCGLDPQWLIGLPERLGLQDVRVQIRDVRRGELACKKVDFEIPPQPHGRHIAGIRAIVAKSDAPTTVRERADQAFLAIATVEGAIHGVSAERVHLHEVGAVDAILDVLGSIWGLEELGVTDVYCLPLALGDGTVEAAHGTLPVPAPATLELLEGHVVRMGPAGSGELVTPTGAALVKVLSRGAPPPFVPRRVGYGAGTKDFPRRANALRVIVASPVAAEGDAGAGASGRERETLVMLAADIDDMTGEYLADAAEALRAAGALDVVVIPTSMKKGRPGLRLEALVRPEDADRLETLLFASTTTIGVRHSTIVRRPLPRRDRAVVILGHTVTVKEVSLPDGTVRVKPDHDAVRRVADATGRAASDIFLLAAEAARVHQDSPLSSLPGVRPTPGQGPAPDHTPHLVRSRSPV